jgi:hypothetical protein
MRRAARPHQKRTDDPVSKRVARSARNACPLKEDSTVAPKGAPPQGGGGGEGKRSPCTMPCSLSRAKLPDAATGSGKRFRRAASSGARAADRFASSRSADGFGRPPPASSRVCSGPSSRQAPSGRTVTCRTRGRSCARCPSSSPTSGWPRCSSSCRRTVSRSTSDKGSAPLGRPVKSRPTTRPSERATFSCGRRRHEPGRVDPVRVRGPLRDCPCRRGSREHGHWARACLSLRAHDPQRLALRSADGV